MQRKNQDTSIEETFQKRTLQITGNTEYIETVQPADITIDADGNYLVTIRAKKAGAVKITASWPDQNRTKEVYFTLLGTGENRQKVSSENRHFQSIKNNQS